MSSPDVPALAGASFPTGPAATSVVPVPPVRRRRWLPPLLIVVGLVCLVVAVPVFRHAIGAHAFPSYVQGDPSYEVRRYSAPWIAGGVALGGLGLIGWTVAAQLLTAARRRPAVVPDAPTAPLDPGLAPRPTEAAREF